MSKLDRREFLKLLGIGGAVAAVAPKELVTAPPPSYAMEMAALEFSELPPGIHPDWELSLTMTEPDDMPLPHPYCHCHPKWQVTVHKPKPILEFDAALAERRTTYMMLSRNNEQFEGEAFVQACGYDPEYGWTYQLKGVGELLMTMI